MAAGSPGIMSTSTSQAVLSVPSTVLVHVFYSGAKATRLEQAFMSLDVYAFGSVVHEDMDALGLPKGDILDIEWAMAPTSCATMKWTFSQQDAAKAFLSSCISKKLPGGELSSQETLAHGITRITFSYHGPKPVAASPERRPSTFQPRVSAPPPTTRYERPSRSPVPLRSIYQPIAKNMVPGLVHAVPFVYPQEEWQNDMNYAIRDGHYLYFMLCEAERHIKQQHQRDEALEDYIRDLQNFVDVVEKRTLVAENSLEIAQQMLAEQTRAVQPTTEGLGGTEEDIQLQAALPDYIRSQPAATPRGSETMVSTHAMSSSEVDELRLQLAITQVQLATTQQELQDKTHAAADVMDCTQDVNALRIRISDADARLESTSQLFLEAVNTATKAVEEAEQTAEVHRIEAGSLRLQLNRSEVEVVRLTALVESSLEPSSDIGAAPQSSMAEPEGPSTAVLAEHQRHVSDLEQRLDDAHCRFKRAEEDANHLLQQAECDLKKAKNEFTSLQMQLDTTRTAYNIHVERFQLQDEQAQEEAKRAHDQQETHFSLGVQTTASPIPLDDTMAQARNDQLQNELADARRLAVKLRLERDTLAAWVDESNGLLADKKEWIKAFELKQKEDREAMLLRSLELVHLPAAIMDVARIVARSITSSNVTNADAAAR